MVVQNTELRVYAILPNMDEKLVVEKAVKMVEETALMLDARIVLH
jgi:hypothetical protein